MAGESELLKVSSRISEKARAIVEKLPSAEAVAVMDEIVGAAKDNNNNNNNVDLRTARPLERDDVMRVMERIPNAELREILRARGII